MRISATLAEKPRGGKGGVMFWTALSADPLRSRLDGELEGLAVAVALDGEFDAAALARGGGPGGLPEVVAVSVGGDDGDPGNAQTL